MKKLGFAVLLALVPTPALADACTDLVTRAELGLSMEDLSNQQRSELQQLLGVGKAGDVAACSASTTGTMQSPIPGRPAGYICEKSQKTV